MTKGDSFENPQIVNLKQPAKTLKLNGMIIDMERLKQAADRLGANVYDVLSIDGFRNAKGELIPDYDSIRIEDANTV